MKRHATILTIIFLAGLILAVISGCNQISRLSQKLKTEEQPQPVEEVSGVANVDLAKLILKPKRKELNVNVDPFRPLDSKEGFLPYHQMKDPFNVRGYQYMGIVKIDDENVALLVNGNKKNFVRIQDQLSDYTVKNIEDDKVVLSNGIQIITLRRSK